MQAAPTDAAEQKEDDLFFFGEAYRECCGRCHVVTACYVMAFTELAILATESVFLLPYKTLLICYGSVKSFSVIRAITGVYKEKYSYLWPFVVVKIIETVLSFLVAVLIATLLFYPISVNNRLVYQISPDQNHSILTILLLISFLSFSTNALFLRIILKCQRYIRRKSLTEYLLLRRHIFHSFLKH